MERNWKAPKVGDAALVERVNTELPSVGKLVGN